MILRMLTSLSGPHYTLQSGDERAFPDDEAIRLINAGFAEPVAAPVERAVKAPAERRKKD